MDENENENLMTLYGGGSHNMFLNSNDAFLMGRSEKKLWIHSGNLNLKCLQISVQRILKKIKIHTSKFIEIKRWMIFSSKIVQYLSKDF